MASLRRDYYGFLGYEVDAEALRNGTLALVMPAESFPTRCCSRCPKSDPLPAPRPIAEIFPPDRDRLTVYLAISARKPRASIAP